jgi:hypothetical protein
MSPGAVVDTESAREFHREILALLSPEDLESIAADLGRKSRALRGLLADGGRPPGRAALREALKWVFATRRRADQVIDTVGPRRAATAVARLLRAPEPVAVRFDAFDKAFAPAGDRAFDLPGELLHFTDPDRYWLWTRWLWDPRTRTGALRLVTADEVDLTEGASRGEVYLTVGRATAFVDETGKAAGFTSAGPGLLGTDVFLAAVYGIYMYTVLRMRMTQEFNRVVPALPDLIRRLLGVYHLEV